MRRVSEGGQSGEVISRPVKLGQKGRSQSQ
jgi:hypothetical protein